MASDGHAETLNRLLALIPFLRKHGGVTIEELVRMEGRDLKAVYKDLSCMLLCGTPPYYPNDYLDLFVEEGKIHLSYADHFERPIRLTGREAIALRIALEILPIGGAPDWQESRQTLISKMDAIISKDVVTKGGCVDTKRELRISKGGEALNGQLKTLQQALDNLQVLRIWYYSASRDALAIFEIEPYGLIESLGRFYLICRDTGGSRLITLRVDRIQEIRQTEKDYQIPEGFSPKEFKSERMYIPTGDEIEVQIKFDAEVARWIGEEFCHDELEENDDGSLILTLEVRPNSFWLINWVLQYGTHAEILSPPEYREMMKSHLQAFLDRVS